MVVWRFRLRVGTGIQHLEMPAGAKMLSVQPQDSLPTLWALCDESAAVIERRIGAFGTGDSVGLGGLYLATVQLNRGVVHYFDYGEIAKPALPSSIQIKSSH